MPSVREATAQNREGPQQAACPPLPPLRKPCPTTSAAHAGELPQGPVLVLAGSLVSTAAMASRMLGWIR